MDDRDLDLHARIDALETVIGFMVPMIWKDGSQEQRAFIAILRQHAEELRKRNAPTAHIQAIERCADLFDDDPTPPDLRPKPRER